MGIHLPGKSLGLLFLILLVAVTGLFIHEAGHGIMAVFLGGAISYFEVMPGLQLYPAVGWHPWDGVVARIDYDLPNSLTDNQSGAITWMGCGLANPVGWTQAARSWQCFY